MIELRMALSDDQLDEIAQRVAVLLSQRQVPASTSEDCWLDSRAASEFLGISRHALHRLTAGRRISFSQQTPGGRCYFKRSDLDAWHENGARGVR